MDREAGGLFPQGCRESDTTECTGAQTPTNPRSSLEYKKYKPGGVQPEAEIHVREGARRGAGTPSVKVTQRPRGAPGGLAAPASF